MRRICRMLDQYLGKRLLKEINGDMIWSISQRELAKGNTPATVNRYLATIRGILRMARQRVAVDRQFTQGAHAPRRSGT